MSNRCLPDFRAVEKRGASWPIELGEMPSPSCAGVACVPQTALSTEMAAMNLTVEVAVCSEVGQEAMIDRFLENSLCQPQGPSVLMLQLSSKNGRGSQISVFFQRQHSTMPSRGTQVTAICAVTATSERSSELPRNLQRVLEPQNGFPWMSLNRRDSPL